MRVGLRGRVRSRNEAGYELCGCASTAWGVGRRGRGCKRLGSREASCTSLSRVFGRKHAAAVSATREEGAAAGIELFWRSQRCVATRVGRRQWGGGGVWDGGRWRRRRVGHRAGDAATL
ncbi:hypothetical protein BU14_0027s0062 [Porphyra umbilicalis]|uniref:Uncharacterized protein n=1 Tax=Porphyra umbilicalis TaxID=2786 RepID=A0A1X6PJU1_PORUM|nr:hypothetical protein BU14_0027s0062 [Porphyra umbilicalis]|eukprot:OSX81036.1 hypothetical protein BU14_0027s0062 [Porphyra umbilicalis]